MRSKLSKKVTLACIVWILFPLIILGLRFYYVSSNLLRDQIMATNLNHIQHIDDYYLAHVNENLEFFLNLWPDKDLVGLVKSEDESWPILEAQWQGALLGYPEIMTIYFGTEEGSFFNANDAMLPVDYDPRVRPWYLKAKEAKGEVIWTPTYEDVVTGEIIFTVAKAIQNTNQETIGVIAIDVTLLEMSELFGLTRIGTEGRVVVIDSEGIIIVSPEESLLGENISKYPWLEPVFYSEKGSFIETLDDTLVISYVTNLETGWKVLGIVSELELTEEIRPFKTLFFRVLWIVTIWAIIGVGGFVFYIEKKVIRPINRLQNLMKKAEKGNFTEMESVNSKSPDEIDLLMRSYNHMMTTLKDILKQITQTSNALKSSSHSALSVSKTYRDTFSDQAAEMEDLNVSVEGLNDSIHQIKAQLVEASKNIRFVSAAMKEMGLSATDVANNAVYTSESIADVLKALEALDFASSKINENVNLLNVQGEKVVDQVNIGKGSLNATSDEIDNIKSNSDQLMETILTMKTFTEEIEDIINSVEDLTEQTSILALNASIEASRAGEHGKGFAAVASAIGRLSEKAKISTRHIEKILKSVQSHIDIATYQTKKNKMQIDLGVEKSFLTLEAFNALEDSVIETSNSIKEISISSDKQLKASKEILNASMKVNDLTMRVSASSEEQLATIEELASSIERIAEAAEENSNESVRQGEISNNVAMVSETLSATIVETASATTEIELLSNSVYEEAQALSKIISDFKMES